MHLISRVVRRMPPRSRKSIKKETIKFKSDEKSSNPIKAEPFAEIPSLEQRTPSLQSLFQLPIQQTLKPTTKEDLPSSLPAELFPPPLPSFLYSNLIDQSINQPINHTISQPISHNIHPSVIGGDLPQFQQVRSYSTESHGQPFRPSGSRSYSQSSEPQSNNQARAPAQLPFEYPWPPSIFANYCVHRKDSAVRFEFERPLVEAKTTIKFNFPYFILKKQGSLKINYALPKQSIDQSTSLSAVNPSTSYWWTKNQVITLSCSEIGDLIVFANSRKARELIIQDIQSNNQSNNQSSGFKIVRLPDEQGYHFTFMTPPDSAKGRNFPAGTISLSMTAGEFEVVRSICANALPQLTGLADIYPSIEGQQ